MADGEVQLTRLQIAILTQAHDAGGQYELRDDDPDRGEKLTAIRGLRMAELLWHTGFLSDPGRGCFYYQLTKRGEEIARVVGAA